MGPGHARFSRGWAEVIPDWRRDPPPAPRLSPNSTQGYPMPPKNRQRVVGDLFWPIASCHAICFIFKDLTHFHPSGLLYFSASLEANQERISTGLDKARLRRCSVSRSGDPPA